MFLLDFITPEERGSKMVTKKKEFVCKRIANMLSEGQRTLHLPKDVSVGDKCMLSQWLMKFNNGDLVEIKKEVIYSLKWI